MKLRKLLLKTLILFIPTTLIGIFLFVTSIHSGGTSCLYFMPPLYLFYKQILPTMDNMVLILSLLSLFLQYVLCLFLTYVFSKLANMNPHR